MTLSDREQVEHLRFMLEELTSPPPDWWESVAPLGVRLSPSQSRVLGALIKAKGALVKKEALLAAIMWDRHGDDEPEIKIIDVYVSKIRARLARAGVPNRIECIWGVGYRWIA